MFSALTTERLELRRLAIHDAEPMFAYRSDPAVARYQSWKPNSVEQNRSLINRLSVVEPNSPGTWFQLALVHRASNNLIGDCGLHFIDKEGQQAEIGITLAPSYQGQGYATEAMLAAIEYLVVELGKHRVFATVDPRNYAAIALVERVGMRKEAHFVESLWLGGEWVDDMIFAMLGREWRSRVGK